MNLKPLHWLALAAACQLSPALAATNLVIYTDSLQNDFEDHSWVTHDLKNISPVHSGQFSIAVSSPTNWQGLYFYHDEFDSTPYASVSFWAHGGTNGGQQIQVQGLLSGKTPSDDTYARADLTTNWQQVTVTFEELDVVGKTNFNGIWIQKTPESSDDTFYIDDVQLNPKPAPPAAVPSKPDSAPAKTKSDGARAKPSVPAG